MLAEFLAAIGAGEEAFCQEGGQMIPAERAVQSENGFILEGLKSFWISLEQLPVNGQESFQAFFPRRWV